MNRMTLIVTTEVTLARGRTILFGTDSMLGAGYRWPRGPKLFSLGCHAAIAFEGDTEIAYPLLINACNFIALSDHLSSPAAEPGAIFERVAMDVSEAYDHLVQNGKFTPDSRCSFVLAGWSTSLNAPVVRQLVQPASAAAVGTRWSVVDVTSLPIWQSASSFFAGNGDRDPAGRAESDLSAGAFRSSRFPAYEAFRSRIDDTAETAVGGEPQVMLLSDRRRETIGLEDPTGRRFLLGHKVQSGALGIQYLPADLSGLQ